VEVQTRGWNYNTEENVDIQPDQNGFVILPLNTLKVDTVGASASINAIQRGSRLYNKTDRTYVFATAATVDMVLGLDFEELPSTARMFITIRAARKYQDRYFGDQASHSYTLQDELTAQSLMMDEELNSRDANMLSDSQFMSDLRDRG